MLSSIYRCHKPAIFNQMRYLSDRVRFAPSPTGSLHIGGARTAMYNWLYAQKMKGEFIIRVEDTDLVRSTRASEMAILQDLSWLQLHWVEGPDVGGPHAPYRQSERKDIYQKATETLISTGHAYRCFCDEVKIVDKRPDGDNSGIEAEIDAKWRDASLSEIQRNLDNKTPYTVRFKVPKGKTIKIEDKVFGPVSWETNDFDDFIIIRSNGMPVYNFCVAIDDIDMKITQVIRAEEHLTNTVKQILIMEALQVIPPQYAHCSIILGTDGAKLSKRHGAASVEQFKAEGYLPLAILSYLSARQIDDSNIVLTLDEIINNFTLDSIKRGPAMFDIDKLKHFNWEYLRAMTIEQITPIVVNQLKKDSARASNGMNIPAVLLPNFNSSSSIVSNFIALASKIARRDMVLTVDSSHLVGKCLHYELQNTLSSDSEESDLFKSESFQRVLKVLIRDFESGVMPSGVEEDFEEKWKLYLKSVGKECKVKGKELYHPVRLGLTGSKTGPEIVDYVRLIGLSSDNEVQTCLNPDFKAISMKERIDTLKELLIK